MNPLVWHLRELISRNGFFIRVRLFKVHTTRRIKIGAEALALLYADQPTTVHSLCRLREKGKVVASYIWADVSLAGVRGTSQGSAEVLLPFNPL